MVLLVNRRGACNSLAHKCLDRVAIPVIMQIEGRVLLCLACGGRHAYERKGSVTKGLGQVGRVRM